MPLVSFKVFKEKLISGEKVQTIRKVRLNPINLGDTLYIWWKSRSKLEKEFLFASTCTKVTPVAISVVDSSITLAGELITEPAAKDEFARKDGFDDADKFFAFFAGYGDETFEGVVIEWEPPDKLVLPPVQLQLI